MTKTHDERQLERLLAFKQILTRDARQGPLAHATEIVRKTADQYHADISKLFVVQDQQLTLAGGYARLGDRKLDLPAGRSSELTWDTAGPGIGMAAQAAIQGQALFIPSLQALEQEPGYAGQLDRDLYPESVAGGDDDFGCLYAVPLLASVPGRPRDAVIGVFDIERRHGREPFGELERAAFDVVASHLSLVVLNYLQGEWAREAGREIARLARYLVGEPDGTARHFFPILDLEIDPLSRDDSSAAGATAGLGNETRQLVERVAEGFQELTIADAHKQAALRNLAHWLDTSDDTRPQLEWLIAQGQWTLLLDSFYRVLPFGTGGRRGPVGIGTNRYNPTTLAGSVQGHIDFLRETNPDGELSVVIVYDVRTFHDLRGLYNPDLPNPLLGMSSRDFAIIAAEVYAGNGVRVYMPQEDAPWFVATPELSYSIRALGATGGLNISASHNFPDDNGGKFYNRHGGQEVPPNDEDMAKRVENARFVRRLCLDRAKEAGLVSFIEPEVHRGYLALNVAQSLQPDARDATIVFTPLHGSGDSSAGAALRRAGFRVKLVANQSSLDGRFPAVPFRAPNPEVPESMEQGVELARSLEADLVMACDPDADRIGVVTRSSRGDYVFLNGNEISVLVAHYKLDQLKRLGRLPDNPLVIKTEVTTELLKPITEKFGGSFIGDLLVGFKYHGTILEQLESPPRDDDPRPQPLVRLGIDAVLEDFIVAVEESHGVLVSSEVRDKDAAGAAILLAELAAVERQKGRTVLDYLEDIYKEFGYYANKLSSMVMTGAEGLEAIKKIQSELRADPPTQIAGHRVSKVIDHLDPEGIFGRILSETDKASRDVLVFRLDNGARIIIRPSGTEPKNKTYIEVPSQEKLGLDADHDACQRQKSQTDAIASEIADDFMDKMLAIIDVELPRYALKISGLVPLDKRIEFVDEFIPAFEERARALAQHDALMAQTSDWIDEALASYGKDARELVRDALGAYLVEARDPQASSGAPSSAALDAMERAFSER